MRRPTIALLLALAAAPTAARLALRRIPAGHRACAPEGRGVPPRGWIGCAGDAGSPRALDGAERLAVGLPLDANRASAAELALVPGLSVRLAEELARDRERLGRFESVDALVEQMGRDVDAARDFVER